MRIPLLFAACAALLGACGDDTPAPLAMDVFVTRDIQPIGTDAVVYRDVAPLDVNNDRGPMVCRRGDYRPCECSPGEGGRQYCITTEYETTCRCGDAGPPDFDATMTADASADVAGDITPTTDAPPADAQPADAGASDAQQGDAAATDAPSTGG